MESFVKFLKIAKEALDKYESFKNIYLVLGNESCDLDSTISALTLAYLKHSKYLKQGLESYIVIPVMNVEAKYFPLRTETCYILKKYEIEPTHLIFNDEIDYERILKNKHVETTIVDHHVLCEQEKILEKTVVEIFDHRPINSKEICKNQNPKQTIKTVGSCTTLITQEYIKTDLPLFKELSYFLYATIIYDTIGLDKECGKTFDEDVTAAEYLEAILKPTQTRKELFNELWKIHNDTSNLGTKELLYRDLKVVQGIPIPGLPLLVENYLKRQDANEAIASFAEEYQHKNAVLIGIDANQEVKRDIAIYFTDLAFKNILVSLLNNSKEVAGSDLLLTKISESKNLVCFKQGNIKLTRKFILPLVNEAALKFLNEK